MFNVLHVLSRLPVGGVENMTFKIVNGYSKDLFNVIICCINEGGKIADELKASGFRVHVLNKMKGHGFECSAVSAIYSIIKRENIHVLRTHQYHANLYGRMAGVLAGVPVIIPSYHNIYDKPKFHRRAFNHVLGRFSDKLVAVSNVVASDMTKYDRVSPDKIRVIYNGIEISKFNLAVSKDKARETLGLPLNTLITGSLGSLTGQKGHQFLIEAASKLARHHIVIAGDGPLMDDLRELAGRLKVDCTFMGMIDPEKIPLFLRALDIFCFPSLWEGFGTALLEAMASGLPVIASDIPPHREVIGDAGIFTPPGDTTKLAEALTILIKDPALRDALGQKAIKRSGLFSIQNTVTAYEDLFREALKKKALL